MSKRIRSSLYQLARFLGDFNAVISGKPGRISARAVNKGVGRISGPRLYLKGRKRR